MKRKYIWAFLDGEPLVEVIQAALDNNMMVDASEAKAGYREPWPYSHVQSHDKQEHEVINMDTIIRQDCYKHNDDSRFYTLYKHYVFTDSCHHEICYTIICEYGDHTFNLFSYTDLETAERVFNDLVEGRQDKSA